MKLGNFIRVDILDKLRSVGVSGDEAMRNKLAIAINMFRVDPRFTILDGPDGEFSVDYGGSTYRVEYKMGEVMLYNDLGGIEFNYFMNNIKNDNI